MTNEFDPWDVDFLDLFAPKGSKERVTMSAMKSHDTGITKVAPTPIPPPIEITFETKQEIEDFDEYGLPIFKTSAKSPQTQTHTPTQTPPLRHASPLTPMYSPHISPIHSPKKQDADWSMFFNDDLMATFEPEERKEQNLSGLDDTFNNLLSFFSDGDDQRNARQPTAGFLLDHDIVISGQGEPSPSNQAEFQALGVDGVLKLIVAFAAFDPRSMRDLILINSRFRSLINGKSCNCVWEKICRLKWELIPSSLKMSNWKKFTQLRTTKLTNAARKTGNPENIPIENCSFGVPSPVPRDGIQSPNNVDWQIQCPVSLSALGRTVDDKIDYCSKCKKNVYLCKTPNEVRVHLERDHTFAIDFDSAIIDGRAQEIPHCDFEGSLPLSLATKVDIWEYYRNGSRRNVRTLISSIHTVLWSTSGWQQVSLSMLVSPRELKKSYRKLLLCIHPDKVVTQEGDEITKLLALRLFAAINTSWKVFVETNPNFSK